MCRSALGRRTRANFPLRVSAARAHYTITDRAAPLGQGCARARRRLPSFVHVAGRAASVAADKTRRRAELVTRPRADHECRRRACGQPAVDRRRTDERRSRRRRHRDGRRAARQPADVGRSISAIYRRACPVRRHVSRRRFDTGPFQFFFPSSPSSGVRRNERPDEVNRIRR